MECCVVLFNPRIHLFACTHPSVSNTFDCNALFVYKHQSPALCSNTFGLWFLVCVHASVSSLVFQTRLDCGCLSVYPPAHTKMQATPELEKILHRARAPNQLSIFLEKEQLFGVDDVALVCSKEELSNETLIAPAKAAGVPCDSLAEKVCIRKVWSLCREAFATGLHGQPASQTEQEDQTLPDEVKRSLDGQWEACHGFVLNTFRLLSETQQNKVYRMSHGAPRAFPIVLLGAACRTVSLSKLPPLHRIQTRSVGDLSQVCSQIVLKSL